MTPLSLDQLVPLLQVSIGPMILVSAVGLLLLTMTNRLARVVDRARLLAREIRDAAEGDRGRLRGQLDILMSRARLIRSAIALAGLSVLLAGVLIIALFLAKLLGFEVAWIICTLFIGCMASLVLAMTEFLRDVNLSLAALRLELRDAGRRT
jgi:hypothetical protein